MENPKEDPCGNIEGNWSGTWSITYQGKVHTFSVVSNNIFSDGHLLMKVEGDGQKIDLLGTCDDGNIAVSGNPGILGDVVNLKGFIIGSTISLKGTTSGQTLAVDLTKQGSRFEVSTP